MKNTKKSLWFKRKSYGWGWTPITWQGWVCTILYVIFLLWRAQQMEVMFDTVTSQLFRYFFEFTFATVIMIGICFRFGESPKWQWGNKSQKEG